MSQQRYTVEWGSHRLEFVLQLADRKRVAIEVSPDQTVLVKAPRSAGLLPVLRIVKSKARWVLRQQRYFEQFKPRTQERKFVSGETHLYLGRRYRLKVHAVCGHEGVTLSGGYLHIYCGSAKDVAAKQRLLHEWYRGHAERVFAERLAACAEHRLLRGLLTPRLSVRKMRRRWGSCTSAGRILLNIDLIRAPRPSIDYVITHELCHLLVPDHSAKFARLLQRVMPDWHRRKSVLERTLA